MLVKLTQNQTLNQQALAKSNQLTLTSISAKSLTINTNNNRRSALGFFSQSTFFFLDFLNNTTYFCLSKLFHYEKTCTLPIFGCLNVFGVMFLFKENDYQC